MPRGVLAGVFAFVLVVCWPLLAHASDVVTDGDAFTIDLTSAHACFILPQDLRNEAACEGFTLDALPPPGDPPDGRTLASALVHYPNGDIGQLLLMRVGDKRSSVDLGVAEKLIDGYARGVAESLSKTAKARTVNTFVVPSKTGGAVRGSVDVSDSNPTPLHHFMEHQEVLALYSDSAVYMLIATGPASSNGAMVTIVEDAMVKARVAHPIPMYEGKDVSELVGRVVFYVLMAIGIGAVALYSRSRNRRIAAEWQARQQMPPPGPWPR